MSNVVINGIQLDAFSAGKSRLEVGDVAYLSVKFSEQVSVNTYNNQRIPILSLNTGGVARYVSGSGSDTLVFSYTVKATDNSTRIGESLSAIAFAENDAQILSTIDLQQSVATPRAADVSLRTSPVGTLPANAIVTPPSGSTAATVTVLSSESGDLIDLLPPSLVSMTSLSGTYQPGDTITITTTFNEVVVVDASASAGLPTLSLTSNGELLPIVATYQGGSGTKSLRFQYQITETDASATSLNVSAFNFNGGRVTDLSGNLADVAILSGQNDFPAAVSVNINTSGNVGTTPEETGPQDTVAATILSIRAVQGDGTYQVGDALVFRVKLSELVNVDVTNGVPMLVLSNGGVALYSGGSGTDELSFSYDVKASDRNSEQLSVLGVAENDASLLDIAGNETDVRILPANDLSQTNLVKINAQAPYVRTIDAIDGIYLPGDEIRLEVRFSEAIAVDGTPTLKLSNNGVASYLSGAGTDTLVFSYTVPAGSQFSASDLDVKSISTVDGTMSSFNTGNQISKVIRPGILSLSSAVEIDATPPQGTIEIDALSLIKGESATVTLTFSEPVANPLSALSISGGSIDALVTDETSEPGTVWKGTFLPDQNLSSLENVIVLDNSKVMDNPPADFGEGQNPSEWDFGNYGVGLSQSAVFAIDTKSPAATISSEAIAGSDAVLNRMITVDFGEAVTGVNESAITVAGGRKVPGSFEQVSDSVYRIVVAPTAGAGTDVLELSVGLVAGAVADMVGNTNVATNSTVFTWDEAPPVITGLRATSGSYVTGDVLSILVDFSEKVTVGMPAGGQAPTLALSNGKLAHYVSGSDGQTLRFDYTIASGDEAEGLDILALFENDAQIRDASGNDARVSIRAGDNSLVNASSILIDGVEPFITTIQSTDGLYLPGDVIEIDVRFSEAVHVDTALGSPVLALSNGALAHYVSGSESSMLRFEYTVSQGDYDAKDLDVLAFAEEGAVIREYFGAGISGAELGDYANVGIRSELNSLAYRSEVNIDSALPQIAQISANQGSYNAGDVVEIAVAWSKGVDTDTTQGEPSLLLNNGALATYVAEQSTATKLVFRYIVSATDTQTADLEVAQFRHGNAKFTGLVAGGEAELSLPDQALSLEGALSVDLTLPEVVSLSLSDTALSAGEQATVTVVLSETVQQFDKNYLTAAQGLLSDFVSADGLTWTGTYTPYATVSGIDQLIRLDQTKLVDLAGNQGVGDAESSLYQLDSQYPTVQIRSDVAVATKEPVRFVLNFSEAVDGFDPSNPAHVIIEGGTLESWSIETPDNSGRPEGEYSFVVVPAENSESPIKVRVPEGVVADSAGNLNARSAVFVQPIDTAKAFIESIDAVEGAYKEGETITFTVNYNEVVSLSLREGISDHEMPELFLNNGQTARYLSGSGTASWVFEYTVAQVTDAQGERVDIDRSPIRVLSLLENDTYLLDDAGNRTEVIVGANHGLTNPVAVDTAGAQVMGFDAVDGHTYLEGQVVWIKVSLDEVVRVVKANDGPVLSLSNGGTATYMAGSGSKTLLFRYQVSQDDLESSDLDVSALSMGAGSIIDAAGNPMPAQVTTFASSLSATKNVAVDTKAPLLLLVDVVEDAGTVTDVVNDGYYKAGTTVAFDVSFDDAVVVDSTSGVPTLTLNNGEQAQYIQGSGTQVLRFEYTVAQDDLNRSYLEVIGLSENGGSIKDISGNDALVEVFADNLNYGVAVVDTKAPKQVSSTDSFAANAQGEDEVRSLETVTFSFGLNEVIEFDLSSIDYTGLNGQTRADLGLAADATDDELAAAISESITAAEHALILSRVTVSFDGSRLDASGAALADNNADLAPTAFRYVTDTGGAVTGFAVDVAVPDRAMGDLHVSVLPGGVQDLATNTNSTTITHTQRVDTQTVELTTTPAAGLFIGSTSTVRVKDLNGDLLASEVQLDPVTGQARVTVSPNAAYPGGYRGPVLIEVIDTDPAPDYIDEFTGEAVTLSDGTTAFLMRAVYNLEEPGEVAVTVSPVTELAVKKLEESMAASSESSFNAQKVSDYNAGIGKIFGIDDIVRTPATVVNSALVESQTGADVTNFDATDGIDAGEKYGQVLAMLSARDSQSGSLAATITEIAAEIKALEAGGQTTLAIKQAGADKLAQALDSSSDEAALNSAGVNRALLDVAYIDEASAAGYGLNLAEAESTSVPVKGAQVGDTVFVQWGVIAQPGTGEVAGSPNRFEVVIDASHVQADGSIRVPVPLSVIEKQGDATEVAVSTAVIPAGSVDDAGNAISTPAESDYRAPVLLTVDIIPPQTTVEAPEASAPFTTKGAVDGIRGGDDLNILLNNSTDEHFKYALSTDFLDAFATALADGADQAAALAAIADQIPAGLSVSNITQQAASGTWSFDWSLDLTQAISVAEQSAEAAAIEAGESYTPVATFTANDERSVFQVQASTADLVGNADADDARNEVIIGSVDDIVDSAEEQSAMDAALNRLSARYGDAAVDTRAEIKTVADAINGITALKNSGDPAATAGDLTSAVQTLVLGSGGAAGTPGAVAAGVHTLSIGDETFAVDLSDTASPTLADVIAEITGSSGYADLPYTVALDTSGNGVDISWKAFGPQPAAASSVAVTSIQSAAQLTSTISNPGSLAAFAVQAIAVDGETVDGSFVPATGDITVGFGGTELSVTVAEGESLADALAGLQGDGDYASLPFRLTINEAGDGLVATWKATQADPVTALITVDRDFDVTTTTEIAATIVAAGSAGVTTQELAALDIQNVDDSELAAINRALASDLASASAPVVGFADSALVAGESTTVSMTFTTRVGQIPDDVMALVGGELSSAGEAGDPIWSTTDGLTWTATFTASSDMPNTALQYAERVDEDGVVVVDANGNAVLDAVVVDATTTPVTYGQAGDDLSQIALTEALVNRVTDAAAKVAAFADSQGAVPVASPSVQDFADMAVSGVRADNLSAVQDALGAIRDRFEGTGDLYTQIQTVTDSYNTVFDTVYTPGATDQPSAADLVEDLSNLGVGNLSTDSARAEDQMTLLQGALRAVAAAKADITNDDSSVTTVAEQQAGMINSVEKLERFVASVEKVLARANGETVDINGTPTPVAVSEDDLSALGFESLLADTSANSRLSSLQKVIADQSEGTGSDSIVAYADLKAVLETAAAAFDDIVGLTAAAQDTTYVDNDARTQALTAALATVDADTFQEMGIDGVTDVAIGTLTAAAMADAVKDALSNTGNAVNSLESIQQVVDSYRQVLSVASGDVSGDQALISKAQFSDLGVSLSADDEQEPASLATLLSGVIANKAAPTNGASTDNVNSVAEIQALADAAKRVFDNANQSADDGGANASQADLNILGFDAVDADNVDAIQRVLTRTASRDGVTSYSDLKAKVDAAVDAHAALTAVVATAQGSATPNLTGLDEDTFSDMGIDGVDAGNYAAMLDALSNTGNTVETALAVQTVVDSYNVLLELGAYSTGSNAMQPSSVTATDLTNIGITLQSGTEDAVAELATGIMASLAEANVDTVDKAQAIVDAIDSVFANTLRTSDDDTTHTTVVSKDELLTLGFSGATDNNIDAIQRVLSDQTGEADVKDYAELKALVENAITAHSDILAAATTDVLTGIDDADYAAMGIDGVDAGNLASINDALINSPNTLTTAASVQAVVDSYNHILDLRAAQPQPSYMYATLSGEGNAIYFSTYEITVSYSVPSENISGTVNVQMGNSMSDTHGDLFDAVWQALESENQGFKVEKLTGTNRPDFPENIWQKISRDDAKPFELSVGFTGSSGAPDFSNFNLVVDENFTRIPIILDAAAISGTVNNGVEGQNVNITLDVDDFTDLGVTLKAAGTEQDQQVAYLQELVANNGGPSVASVANIQKLADATSDLIDLIKGNSPDSDSTYGLTVDQWALLGITTDADEVDTLNARLALTADDLSEVANLTTALADRVQESRTALAKIRAYAETDGLSDFDGDGSFAPTDSDDVPSVQDYNFIGVTAYSFTETIGGSGWNVSNGTDANGDLLSRLTGSSSVTFFYDENNTLIKSSGTLTKLRIVEETTDHIEFYVYGELSANINNTSTAAPNGPYYGWQHLRFERDSDGVITRTLPPAEGVNGSLTQYSFLDDPAYVGITSDLSALGVQDATVTHGQGAFFGLNTGTINYLASENALYVEPVVQTSDITIDGTNLAAINELFAATGVGADAGDDPATKRSEVQYVIDQNVGRLQALAKIANYADNNGADLATYPAPDAADFAAAGVSGVADDNNIPALLVKLKSLGSSSNYAATNTAAELQAFVKTVAIEKIKAWTDSDGGNSADPLLHDYLNAGLVNHDDSTISAAIVPALNELFAGAATNAGDADNATEQQGVIDGAATMLAALAKIANYADADGAIDFTSDGVNDHLTVADFEAAGISGVADGTDQSAGTGTSVAANGYDNLDAVLAKLAENGIAFINADTVDEVQQLVTDVAVEKINAYADADGVLPLETKTISVYVDAKTGGSGNAFYLDNVEAPAIELKAGTYTFDQSDTTNNGHPLNFYATAESGSLPAGITVSQTGTPGTAGAQTVVVVDETFSGTVYYACSNHTGMGNSAEVELPYFTPELQDYLNAGLVEDSAANPTAAINANQVVFANALFASGSVGGTTANSDVYHSDTQANQQAVIDDLGASMLALEKFVDYMLGENGVQQTDFIAQDFIDAGLARVDGTNYSAILNRLPNYEASIRSDLDSVDKIQAFVSRAIIAEYNANQANQAPTGDDYVAAGISGADGDNYAAMNYQVAQIATGSYTDTIAALEGLVSSADETIARLSTFDLDHVAPISNDAQVVLGRSHDGSAFVPYVLGLADFGDYQDPSSDPIDKIKITSLPSASAGSLYLQTATATASETAVGAPSPSPVVEVQTLTGITPVANAIYELTVGSDTVSVTADADPTAGELAALLDTALDTLGIGVTESSGDIVLTWDSAGSVTGLVTVVERSPVQSNDEIAVTDIQSGKLTYLPASTAAAASFDFKVIDGQGNASDSEYTLAIDRGDFSAATGIANTGLVQSDTNVYSQPLYIGDALTGYDDMSSLRVVISAQGGNVKLGNLNGATEIITGFDRALVGGDEICIQGTQAQINAALKTLRTNITTGQDKVDISIDVQPGGLAYNPENGHFYEYVASSSITWDDAKAAAEGRTFEGMTGYLATPTSANENAFIASKVSAQAWIGASDVDNEGEWKWMTGPEADTQFWQGASNGSAVNGEYENWASGEPNDSGGEDHAHYLSSGMWNDFRFNNSSIQGYMVEYGGLDGDVPTVKSGVRTLTVYATEALGNVSMILSDFETAGITGVDSDNIAAINRVLSLKSASDVDTNPKLQTLVNDTIAAIAKVEDYNNAANGVTTLDENDYLSAGIVGVNAANVAAINNKVSALNVGGADTHAEIQAVVSQDVIEAYADAVDAAAVTASSLATPTVADYHALELYGVDASNVDAINAFVLAASTDLADDANEIALLVQEALEMQPYLAAVAKISAYADANGVGVPAPTLEDYVDAQIKGVSEYNLGMANALFAASTVGTGDTTPSGTQVEQQAILVSNQAVLSAYTKIISYAVNQGGPVPVAADYVLVGFSDVVVDDEVGLNAGLLGMTVTDASVSVADIETVVNTYIVAMRKIQEFTNTDGVADTDADFSSDTGEVGVPEVSDYQAIGLTNIINPTNETVAVGQANVAAINEILASPVYGTDTGDTAVTNIEALRSILNGTDNAKRLNAISKISQLANAPTNALTLKDDSTSVGDGDELNLKLTTPFGTSDLTATYSTANGWSGVASDLRADLPYGSGFDIVAETDGVTILRTDGATFSVTAQGGAGTWSLQDANNSSATLSFVSGAATGTIQSVGSGPALNLTLFQEAGVSGISAANIEATVADLRSAASSPEALDTLKEIQAVANNKVAVFELLDFVTDGELYKEVSTTFNYARANYDAAEIVSSGYYLWDEGESGARPRILGAADAFDGSTSTTANGWWVSEREDVGGNDDHYGIFGRANYQAYLGYHDTDGSEGPTLLQSVSFSNYTAAQTLEGRVQGYDDAKGVWVTIKSFATTLAANATHTINVASDYGTTLEKKAYDGYRLVFDEASGNWGPRVDITELEINVKKVLPLATPDTFTQAGISGVTLDNIDQVRKVVLENTTNTSTITEITSVVNGVVAGLQTLQSALAANNLASISHTTYDDVGIEGVDVANIDAVNAIAVDRQATLQAGDSLKISDLQRIADDVSTNFGGLLSLGSLMRSQASESDKFALAQKLLSSDRAYVPDLGVNAADAQTAINKLLGLSSSTPTTNLEGLGVVAKEIYANWAGGDASPSLGDASDTTHGYTPWEAFNGVLAGDAEGYASTAYVSKDRPGSIGWFDSQTSQGPTLINSFKIDAVAGKMPTVFDLYGFNVTTEVWEFVQSYDISNSYVDETSLTFDVDTFRAFSGFRLDIFAPSTIDGQTGEIDYPNPQDPVESLNPDIIVRELTFNVDSSKVLVNAGLEGITDAQTLLNVLDAIGAATAANSADTDTLSKVKLIASNTATETIRSFVESVTVNSAPTLSDYRLLGVTTYDSGTSAIPLDADNLAAINELVAEKAAAFTGSALQTLLDDSSNVARLDAIAKIAAYAEDNTSAIPDEGDYADLGVQVSAFDGTLTNANSLIDAVTGVDADTVAEINAFLSNPVEILGVDINDDGDFLDPYEIAENGVFGSDDGDTATGVSTISVYLDVSDAQAGDVIELYADGQLVATSSALTSGQISGGAAVELSTTTSTTEFDLSSYDTTSGSSSSLVNADADKVILELRVQDGSNNYSQNNGDVTWEYQW